MLHQRFTLRGNGLIPAAVIKLPQRWRKHFSVQSLIRRNVKGDVPAVASSRLHERVTILRGRSVDGNRRSERRPLTKPAETRDCCAATLRSSNWRARNPTPRFPVRMAPAERHQTDRLERSRQATHFRVFHVRPVSPCGWTTEPDASPKSAVVDWFGATTKRRAEQWPAAQLVSRVSASPYRLGG